MLLRHVGRPRCTHTVLALRASEARYRTLFESTAAGVYQATCDDRLISVNPAIITMLGYESEEELLRLDFGLEIYANAEDHNQWRRELDAAGELRSRETTLRTKKGERLVVLHSARLVRDSRGVPLYYEGTIADITASHRQARQWSHEASHDSLTGLLNRRELERRLQSALEDAAIDRSTLAVVMIDLDGFKKVNDRFGHVAGDELLRQVSGALRASLRTGDVVGRFGGDEFLVLLEHCSEEDAVRVTAAMTDRLRKLECLWAGQALHARASIGIAIATARDQSWTGLVERAHRRLQMRNYVHFLQTFQQRPQRGRIPSLLAVSLCSVANESLDTFFAEAFHFDLALPHPLVERSHKAEFVGDTLFGISSVGKRISEVGDV